MVIEYIGTIIRNEVANRKEKLYESQVSVTAIPSLSLCANSLRDRARADCRAGSVLKKSLIFPLVFTPCCYLQRCMQINEPGWFSRHLATSLISTHRTCQLTCCGHIHGECDQGHFRSHRPRFPSVSRTEERTFELFLFQNRGVYMFRMDNDHVIDATLTGGPAR